MKKVGFFAISLVLTVYEIAFVKYLIDSFSGSAPRLWGNMPVLKSEFELVAILWQLPVIVFFLWIYSRRRNALEKDFMERYAKKDKP